jgi:glycosyltransferase involved in cell wall biosynthesis
MSSKDFAARPAGLSLVMPAYDEEEGIEDAIASAQAVLAGLDAETEILVVDDGSTDRTAELAEKAGARVISLPENCGYGAAIKAGIEVARHDKIAITDADGTYPADALPALLARADRYDMVVGSRQGANVAIPWARRPAKWFLNRLASYLAGRHIPDLNSGLRVMDRGLLERYEHILPQGFSLTTTITLAALCNGHLVYYHPIDYYERSGRSKIRPRHALDFLLLVLRTVVYFNPLKVFIPLGAVFFGIGLGKFGYDVWKGNFSETALMGLLGGTLLWSVGLLADQIARVGLRGGSR